MPSRWRYDMRWSHLAKEVVESKDLIETLYHEMNPLGSELSLDNLKAEGKVNDVFLLGLVLNGGVTKETSRIWCGLESGKVAEIAHVSETIGKVTLTGILARTRENQLASGG